MEFKHFAVAKATTASFYTWRKRLHGQLRREAVTAGTTDAGSLDPRIVGEDCEPARVWAIALLLGEGVIWA